MEPIGTWQYLLTNMLKIIILSMTVLAYNYVIATCPNGTYTMPSNSGSKWDCIALYNFTENFPYAQYYCENTHSGSLVSVPNGFVNTILAGKKVLRCFMK